MSERGGYALGRDICALLRGQRAIYDRLEVVMATVAELSAKVDELQVALDNEQEQIQAALDALRQTINDLQALIADGGTAEERQALYDKLNQIQTDLEGTIPDEAED